MDKIFYNGRICTLDDQDAVYQSVGISNGCVEVLGDETQIKGFASLETEYVDLKGATMFPGFFDAHNHLAQISFIESGIDLSQAERQGINSVVGRIEEEAKRLPPGSWIMASSYSKDPSQEERLLTKKDLDPISPNHPVFVIHKSLHTSVLNSRGMEKLVPAGGFPEQESDLVGKDEHGRLNGIFSGNAMSKINDKLFEPYFKSMDRARRVLTFSDTSMEFAKLGIVLAADALVTPLIDELYREALNANRLHVRVYEMYLERWAETLIEKGCRTGDGDSWLRLGPIKLWADGGMSNRTAAVSEPYRTEPRDTGTKYLSASELAEKVRRYHELGFQIAVHAQGDATIQDVLDAFEAVLGKKSTNPPRHRIEHGACMYPNLLERAASMNIPVSVQPAFIREWGDISLKAFGPERSTMLYPFKSMLEAGIRLGASSDSPAAPLDPRIGMRDAVLRSTRSGKTISPEQALTMDQALRLYACDAAWLSFDEQRNGRIAPGMRADFTIMEEDPRRIALEEVPDIPFVMTVIGGEIVYNSMR